MKKNILTIVGITILFLGTCITSSVAIYNVKKSSLSNNSGNTLYIGGTGPNNYTKIQDAIDEASNGDIVFVYDDSSPYLETIEIFKSIKLIGENRDTTVINGRFIYDHVITILADYTTISGFTITNSDKTRYGILIDSDNNFISDCNLIDNHLGGIVIDMGCCNNHISYCYFKNEYLGIDFSHNTDTNISYCLFEGDYIKSISSPKTVVSDCKFTGPYSDISLTWSSDNSQIINCSINSSYGSGINIEGDNTEIKGCKINNCWQGIMVGYGPEKTSIINCTIAGCLKYAGIYFYGHCFNSYISGCNISNNYFGIDVFGGIYNSRIYDCNFANNEIGISIFYSGISNHFLRNNFIDNKEQFYFEDTVRFMLSYFGNNYWSDWRGILPFYHVFRLFNWDWHPAKEPYDIDL